ncbi:MAG TPA: S8 family serine peptidase [Chloroflexota bacterium]
MSVVAVLSVVAGSTVLVEAAGTPGGRGTTTVAVARGSRTFQTTTVDIEPAPDGRPMRAGSLVVEFRRGTDGPAREAVRRDAQAQEVEDLGGDQERVQVDSRHTQEAMARLRARPEVGRVEPEYVARAVLQPNDPRFAEQWGMTRIGAPLAWDISRGVRTDGSPVKIAVLDCGIYDEASSYQAPDGGFGHPDMRNKVVARQNFTVAPDADDYCNHGTHVAGIAAARTNNGIGVAGVGYDAQILNGKVLDDTGTGTTTWISQGITWAAQNGAKVINMSLGAAGGCPVNVQQAINGAWAAGVVVVAAAGNDGLAAASWPANCANVLAVAATDSLDRKASFSNYGDGVAVAAPGVDILSADYTGGYWSFSGTSMASPHAAGLAALVWASSYGTSASAVVSRIIGTADRIGNEGTYWRYGRINALAAVAPSGLPTTPPLAPTGLLATAPSASQIDLTWTDASSDEDGFALERSTDALTFAQITTLPANTQSYSDTGLAAATTYYYRVRATNAAGASPFSGVASATTRDTVPIAPSALSATALTGRQVRLSWTDRSTNETGFKIERRRGTGSWSQIATAARNATTYTDSGLVGGAQYTYRVRAYNSAGNSAYATSNQVTARS